MHSPEFSSGNNFENSESLRAINEERGEKTNEVVKAEREALLKRKAELEASLREAGVELVTAEDILEEEVPEEDSPENEALGNEATPAELAKNITKNPNFKKAIAGLVIGLAATLTIGGITARSIANARAGNNVITNAPSAKPKAMTEQAMTPVATPVNLPEAVTVDFDQENTQFAGETVNGVKYDYTEYADRNHKESYNAYGYDYSNQFGNREEAAKGIMHMAEREPEALASYAYNIFTDDEKQELGIKGLSMVEIDNKFDQAGGGALQQNIKDKFSQILNDQGKTSFNFYHENDTEDTNYIYFVDENKDGNFTPDELHLGYDTKKRNNAPQVDISRTITNPDGTTKTVKMLDLNMKCGYQPNYEKAPIGVPQIPANKPVPHVITGGGPNGGGGGGSVTPDPKPTPKPKPKPDPTPTPKIKPKDAENLTRIDDQINEDIAKDIGTGAVNPGYNPGVSPEDLTAPPAPGDYGGTSPVITPSEPSKGAEDVQPTAPENNYGEDHGGANDGNANPNPVQEDTGGQEEADRNEVTNPPTGGDDLEDALGDLGIN